MTKNRIENTRGLVEGNWIERRSVRGNMTTTTALFGVSDAAERSRLVLGYTVSYAVANVLLTFLGPVIVFTV